jgi:voltage-gated potassium channel
MSNSTSQQFRSLVRSGTDRRKILFRTNIILLLALSTMIFIVPVIHLVDHQLTKVLLGIVVVSGLFAADFNKTSFRILFIFAAAVILVTLLSFFFLKSEYLADLTIILNILFFIVVTGALVTHVATAKEVYGSTLICAINSYLLIGLTVSLLFILMDMVNPESFTQVDSTKASYSTFIYYGFVTLSTLGYGDITPDTPLARSFSIFTALFGQLYLVTIMAIIIGKLLNAKKTTE